MDKSTDEVVEILELEEVEESVAEEEERLGLSPTEISGMLGEGYDGKRVRRLLRSGTLKGQKIDGRWYVTEEDVENYIATRSAKAVERAAAKAAKESAVESSGDEEDELIAEIEMEEGEGDFDLTID